MTHPFCHACCRGVSGIVHDNHRCCPCTKNQKRASELSFGKKCKRGDFEGVKWSIEKCGLNFDFAESLLIASEYGHNDIVEWFMDRGVRFPVDKLNGMLINACLDGRFHAVVWAVENGADNLDHVLSHNRNGSMQIVRYLIHRLQNDDNY